MAEQPHALLRAALLDQGWRKGDAITAISDGDPAEPILDWFYLSMRIHYAGQVMSGLCVLEPPPSVPPDQAQIDVERLRHLLWNDHYDKVCEVLGRIASWAEGASVLDDPAMGVGALCQEDASASCCARDEGGPFGAAL